MPIEVILWIFGAFITMLLALVGTIWSMMRSDKKAQDDAIDEVRKFKADKTALEDGEKRFEKEVDRLRFEHEKVISRVEGRFEKELENVESRIISRFDNMEANFLRQFEILMEIVKKDKT